MLLTSALICLAANIYYESRGEPLAGQVAVAHVTMNRARATDKSVCEVVLQPHQFSWTRTHVVHTKAGPQIRPKDKKSWKRAVVIAMNVKRNWVPDPTHGAHHFHAVYVKPSWSTRLKKTVRIGLHQFYLPKLV